VSQRDEQLGSRNVELVFLAGQLVKVSQGQKWLVKVIQGQKRLISYSFYEFSK